MQIPVFRVPKSGKSYVWLLAPFRGLWTHYVRRKTQPCLTHDCPHCGVAPARWKGYAPALTWRINPQDGKGSWLPCVLEITERVQDLTEREDLVGSVVLFSRLGTKPNGPLVYEKAPEHLQPKGKAPVQAFDVEPILERLYDLVDRHLRPTAPPPAEEPPAEVPDVLRQRLGTNGHHTLS